MFNTFRASIETDANHPLLEKGNVFRFDPRLPHTVEWISYNISHEVFKFSKEDIIFSNRQKEEYGDYISLDPYQGSKFADGVKYKLVREHVKGRIVYYIEVDDLKVFLKLNWINRGLIEWVHGRKINWNMWIAIGTVAGTITLIVGLIISAVSEKKELPAKQPPTQKSSKFLNGIDTIKKTDSTKPLH